MSAEHWFGRLTRVLTGHDTPAPAQAPAEPDEPPRPAEVDAPPGSVRRGDPGWKPGRHRRA